VQTDGILDSLQASGGSSAERGGVHDYGVAFHAAVQIQVRAVTASKTASSSRTMMQLRRHLVPIRRQQEWTSGSKSPATARVASVHGFIGNIPSAAVNDQRWFHEDE